MSSKPERKRQLREEREARREAEARAATRKRRLGVLAGVAAAAAAVVIALAVLSGDDDSGPDGLGDGNALTGGAESRRMMAGIPQKNLVLGRASAPVTLVEYVDLQCPFCAQYATQVAPDLIARYVRTGKLRIEQRTVRILGDQSGLAANYAAAAARQNKLFQFNELFFRNQGQENSGYVTEKFLDQVARGAGLDAAAAKRAAGSPEAFEQVSANERSFADRGLNSTPSFMLGKTGSKPKALKISELSTQEFSTAIDQLLAGT